MVSFFASCAWLGADEGVARDVTIDTTDGRISAIRTATPAPADAVKLPGVVLPGLVNAHSHAFHRALRGRTQAGRGDFWTWRQQMYQVVARLNPDNYHRLARAVYTEMALAGITTVCEFHYVHHDVDGRPYADPAEMPGALARAAAEAGVDLVLLDTCYLRADVDGTTVSGPQRRFADADAAAWNQRATEAARRLAAEDIRPHVAAAAIHSVRGCPPEAMRTVADWSRRHDTPLHMHLSEQVKENRACLEVHGRTPTQLCADNGVLDARLTAVHATHLTDTDIALLGDSETNCCFCPTTERDLADGIGPSTELVKAGAPLSLGSDSHAVIDMFEEARGVELDERLASQRRGHHTADSLLHAATRGGAAAAGVDAGHIAPGAEANLIAVDPRSVRLAGTGMSTDPAAAAVFGATASDVTHVVRRGEVIVDDRRHYRFDDPASELDAAIGDLLA